MPVSAPPKNKPGGLAVLAEIEVIEPELKRHRREFSRQFSSSLSPKIPAILSAVGIENPPSPQVSSNLVTQTVHQSLENVGKIQSTAQLQQVVTDALTQSVISQEGISGGKAADQVYEKMQEPAAEVVAENQKGLEEEAVLANIAQIASLQKPNSETTAIIRDEVESVVESEDPLMPPQELDQLISSVETYLERGRKNLNTELASVTEENLPSLEKFQEIKNKAHDQTISQLGDTQIGNVNLKELASDIGAELGLKPLNGNQADKFGLGFAEPTSNTFKTRSLEGQSMGLRLASSTKNQEKAILALTAHDGQKMGEAQRNPRLREFSFFKKAKSFPSKKSGEMAKYANHFQGFPGGLNRASQTAWRSIFAYLNRYPGIFVPQSILNDRVLVSGGIGALSRGSGSFSFGNVVSGTRGLTSGLKSAIGFGKGAKGVVMAGKLAFGASNPAGWAMLAAQALPFLKKHAAKIIAGAIGLGMLLLLMLLKLLAKLAAIAAGAATGAVIGAVLGFGLPGAIIGAIIGAGVGWIVSNWAVPVANFVGSVFSGLGSAASSVGLAINSLGSAIVSGAGSVLSGALGVLGGSANFVMSLGSLSIPAGAVFAPLAIGIGAVGIGGILVGTITATSFFNSTNEGAVTVPPPGASIGNWPTDGLVTQGPQGSASHKNIFDGSKAEAMDIANVASPPVFSTINGLVKTIFFCSKNNSCNSGYGNYVEVADSAKSFSILYGHLSSIDVSQGAPITPNSKLGIMGNNGNSTATHLHWEFRGIGLAPPNIPQTITPPNCDTPSIPCNPAYVTRDPNFKGSPYWFLLDRLNKKEYLYQGVPGDKGKSQLVKTFAVNPMKVNPGIPGGIEDTIIKPGEPGYLQRWGHPTPLPQKVGREYWTFTGVNPNDPGIPGGKFLILDVPPSGTGCTNPDPNNKECGGPVPYIECGPNRDEQCNWGGKSGQFGLHGVDATHTLEDTGSQGCVRHSTEDMDFLWNLLHDEIPKNRGQIRYYIQDGV
ncbi:MAG: M23 family metallopeptidase [Candidatus Curtissbacteria bacterium]|nr:M23 family metallopeptidase [Candidatus Curtissbacteria bacterium]